MRRSPLVREPPSPGKPYTSFLPKLTACRSKGAGVNAANAASRARRLRPALGQFIVAPFCVALNAKFRQAVFVCRCKAPISAILLAPTSQDDPIPWHLRSGRSPRALEPTGPRSEKRRGGEENTYVRTYVRNVRTHVRTHVRTGSRRRQQDQEASAAAARRTTRKYARTYVLRRARLHGGPRELLFFCASRYVRTFVRTSVSPTPPARVHSCMKF